MSGYFSSTPKTRKSKETKMKIIVERLVDKMLYENMISQEDKEWYIYSLQIVIEKTIGLSTILLLGVLFDYLFQTIGFWLVFSGIRKYSGGFHLKHFWSCYLFSVGTYLIFVQVYQKFVFEITSTQMILVTIVCLGIYSIGAVNNQEIHWNKKECLENTSLTRISVLIIYVGMLGLILTGTDASYLWFMSWGLFLVFVSLLLEKLVEKLKLYDKRKQ